MKWYAEALRILPCEYVSDNNPFVQEAMRFTPIGILLLKFRLIVQLLAMILKDIDYIAAWITEKHGGMKRRIKFMMTKVSMWVGSLMYNSIQIQALKMIILIRDYIPILNTAML